MVEEDPDDPHTVQDDAPPYIVICLSDFTLFCKFFLSMNIYFFLVKTDCLEPPSPFLTLRLSENLSRLYVVWTNSADLGTTYDVTSRDDCNFPRYLQENYGSGTLK
jgi:hypothetical protein